VAQRWPCHLRLSALVACLFLCPVIVLAQEPDPFTSARVHLGPFAVTPTFGLTNVGVDTNVFNDWVSPRSDFTATVTPAADIWLRLGPARLNLEVSGSYLYFAHYTDQRAFGTTDSARLEFPLLHLRPWVEGSFLTVRDRPGYEINLRVRRTETAASGGVDFLVSKRTTLGASMKQARTSYDTGESFLGYSLREALNRTTTTATASLRYALTPLTTFVVAADVVQERFEFSSIRDSDGFRVVPGVEFAATALVTGSARVGFRRLTMKTAGMPDYTGPVAAVDLGYTLLGITRFSVQVQRDVEYSYDPAQPYYLLTGVTGSVAQAVGGPWSIEARAGIQRLAYQMVGQSGIGGSGSTDLQGLAGRVDIVRFYGGGIGYKLGPSTRLGVNVDYYTRRSAVVLQQYRGLRVGTSVTYGF
jgi:hypothetical protein